MAKGFDLPGGFFAIHHWHHQVHKHQVYAVLLEFIDRYLAVFGSVGFIAQVSEHHVHHLPVSGLIIYD